MCARVDGKDHRLLFAVYTKAEHCGLWASWGHWALGWPLVQCSGIADR